MAGQRPENNKAASAPLGEAQAALWLSESLILALLEANLLNADTILEAIDIVIAAKKTRIAEGGDPEADRIAITHLASLSASIAAARAGVLSREDKPGERIPRKPST